MVNPIGNSDIFIKSQNCAKKKKIISVTNKFITKRKLMKDSEK